MKQTEVQSIEQHAMQQSIDTIGTRINALGVREPTIQEYNLGTNQILVELPGVDDLSRVRDIIQSTARLEIHSGCGRALPHRGGSGAERWGDGTAGRYRHALWRHGTGINGPILRAEENSGRVRRRLP